MMFYLSPERLYVLTLLAMDELRRNRPVLLLIIEPDE